MVQLAARLVLWLVPIYVLFIGAMPLIGSSLPQRDAGLSVLGFATCKLPCWAGITPGVTPFAEASLLLADNLPAFRIPTFLTTSTLTFQTINTEPAYSGILYYDGTRVSEVHLDIGVPLWHLLDTLGTPDCVWVSGGGAQTIISLFWEKGRVSTGAYLLFTEQRGWRLYAPTRYLQMSTFSSCDIRGALPWQGFAPAWKYEEWDARPD